jgi:quercetin dioxygenase-like cupin family protein
MSESTGPSTIERASGNIFIRECRLPNAGDVLPFHIHRYDHTMFFMSGRARLRTITEDGSGSIVELEAPAETLVPKGIKHEITALTDDVMFCCVFPHRDAVGRVTLEPVDSAAYW